MKNCVNLSVKEEIIKYLKRENYITANSDDSYYIRFEKKFDNKDKEVQKIVLVQIYQIRKDSFLIKAQAKLVKYFQHFKSQDVTAENIVGFQKIICSIEDLEIFLEKFKMLRFLRKYFDL